MVRESFGLVVEKFQCSLRRVGAQKSREFAHNNEMPPRGSVSLTKLGVVLRPLFHKRPFKTFRFSMLRALSRAVFSKTVRLAGYPERCSRGRSGAQKLERGGDEKREAMNDEKGRRAFQKLLGSSSLREREREREP